MATYRCLNCSVEKDDTLNSQLNTRITCESNGNQTDGINFHKWKQISEDDLVL